MKASILALFLAISLMSFAQQENMNLPNYDDHKWHFGFGFGITKPMAKLQSPSLSAEIDNWFGFSINLIADYNLNNRMSLRFSPGMSYNDRKMYYYATDTVANIHKVGQTLYATDLDFPIELKIKAKRKNNMQPFLLFGGQYSCNVAEQGTQQVSTILDYLQTPISLETNNWSATGGIGVDLYRKQFKMSCILRYVHGLNNVRIEDSNVLTPFEKMYLRNVVFTITFENAFSN